MFGNSNQITVLTGSSYFSGLKSAQISVAGLGNPRQCSRFSVVLWIHNLTIPRLLSLGAIRWQPKPEFVQGGSRLYKPKWTGHCHVLIANAAWHCTFQLLDFAGSRSLCCKVKTKSEYDEVFQNRSKSGFSLQCNSLLLWFDLKSFCNSETFWKKLWSDFHTNFSWIYVKGLCSPWQVVTSRG